jgi:hypothetical protein
LPADVALARVVPQPAALQVPPLERFIPASPCQGKLINPEHAHERVSPDQAGVLLIARVMD